MCNFRGSEGKAGESEVQGWTAFDFSNKQTNKHVVECLPSTHEALGSIPACLPPGSKDLGRDMYAHRGIAGCKGHCLWVSVEGWVSHVAQAHNGMLLTFKSQGDSDMLENTLLEALLSL